MKSIASEIDAGANGADEIRSRVQRLLASGDVSAEKVAELLAGLAKVVSEMIDFDGN